MPLHLRLFLVILGLFLFVSCSSSKNTENDSDIFPDFDSDNSENIVDDDKYSLDDYDSVDDFSKTTDEDSVKSDINENSSDDDFSLTQECFGKKILTKEIVEVDKWGDGFENDVDNDFRYQIDRYYDKNCRLKFETRYKIDTDKIYGSWDGSYSPSYEYDEKGNVIKTCTRDKEGKLSRKYSCRQFSYEFNNDGTIKKMCEGNSTEGDRPGCVYYYYDEKGRIKQRIRHSGYNMGYLLFYRDFSDIGSEYFSDDYSVYGGDYDRKERIDYFYDEKGRISRKERFFLLQEFDENDNVISIRDYSVTNRMTAKAKITYEYNAVKLPVKSHHFEDFNQDFNNPYSAEYERFYFYDEKMRPLKITTNCISCGPMWREWLDEWEYYPDGTLKRKRESTDRGGGYTERFYDEKGREVVYQEFSYTGKIWVRKEYKYRGDTNELESQYRCYEETQCFSSDYKYEHDESGRIILDSQIDETAGGKLGRTRIYKYTQTGQISETRQYYIFIAKDGTEEEAGRAITIYIYDSKDRLVETRFADEWDEENPDISKMDVIYKKYDSFGRIIRDNRLNYTYHGETEAKDSVWYLNGIISYTYNEKGMLVSEEYDPLNQTNFDEYILSFKYGTDSFLTSSEKSFHVPRSQKESRKYFYTTFKGE